MPEMNAQTVRDTRKGCSILLLQLVILLATGLFCWKVAEYAGVFTFFIGVVVGNLHQKLRNEIPPSLLSEDP